MPQQHQDSPYADEKSSSRPSSSNGRTSSSRRGGHRSSPPPAPAATNGNGNGRKRRRRGKGTYKQSDELTSHPTTRNAYVGTREWLLAQHGPVCAYCGSRFAAEQMTLDHVAPRRGQTAYDRRDNLVLACQPCNAAKRDLAPLAFLLGNRKRAMNLVRFGEHLSAGLRDLARSLCPADFDEDSPYRD